MADSPAPRSRVAMLTEVRRSEPIGESMIRVVLGGGELERFTASPYTDSYVKLVFLSPGVEYPRPLDVNAVKTTHAAEDWPRLRTYTVREWDSELHELTLDVVVHGDAGLAGPWARAVQPGDEVFLVGPGGEYAPDLTADWHLLVGDESALPAICVALSSLPAAAVGHAFLEVEGPQGEVPIEAPAGVTVTWLHRGGRPVGQLLVDAVSGLEFPSGQVHAFVHGEAGFVKELRRLLRVDLGIAREQLSISGYWRYGADDESWRAAKRQWNREVEAAEVAAGVS
ncbi:MAG: siderophore-interacting protein [Mycobacterium sp.]|nr:siderophore-interacting protein [Mycobacterium sp.]